ncbi:MAG: hypothetical protein ACRDZN_15495, partial [Acidimicrobiales bacterium]
MAAGSTAGLVESIRSLEPAAAAAVACTPGAGFNNCVRFTNSGADQTFVVPKGVTSINVRLWGAGGGGNGGATTPGGAGGFT